MEFLRLGDAIKQVEERNRALHYQISDVKGISIQKKLIATKANMENVPLASYKILKYDQFAYVTVTSRNGGKVSIALNKGKNAIVSATYIVFETDATILLPEFLYIFFNRAEFDRFSRFHSWGSARETFVWEDLCDIEIPFLPIDEQKKFVAVYHALQANQKSYEDSLEDLQLICEGFIENLIKTEEKKLLGDYISECNVRNYGLKNQNLLGISVQKKFIPTKANMDGLELANYKIVNENEFGFVTVTSRNGGKISIALLRDKPGLLSSTYTVFKVTRTEELLPEFLYLWFSRPEFDRYARYHSWGSARETFNWDDLCNVKLPIPDIKAQEAIVTVYKTLETRKKLNETLKESLVDLCPVLMKGARDLVGINK